MLRRGLVAPLLVLFGGCSLAGATRPIATPAQLAAGDCGIYSALLNATNQAEYELGVEFRRGLPPLLIVVPPREPNSLPWPHHWASAERTWGVPAEQIQELAAGLAQLSGKSHTVRCDAAILRAGQAFKAAPDGGPETRLSPAARTRDGRFAAIELSIHRGPLDGAAYTCLLERGGAEWRLVRCDLDVIS